jgi:hypothetical protein
VALFVVFAAVAAIVIVGIEMGGALREAPPPHVHAGATVEPL